MKFREGIAYAGLGDVVGGKMWHCIEHENTTESCWFWTKKECRDYIRKMFSGDTKKYLMRQLDAIKGRRAYMSH